MPKKKDIWDHNIKSEHPQWIQHNGISLSTNFDFFLTKFAQKGYFRFKTKKVNTTTEICKFELV